METNKENTHDGMFPAATRQPRGMNRRQARPWRAILRGVLIASIVGGLHPFIVLGNDPGLRRSRAVRDEGMANEYASDELLEEVGFAAAPFHSVDEAEGEDLDEDRPPGNLVIPQVGAVESRVDLWGMADEAGWVFDGSLTRANAVTPEGLRVLTTEYVFEVNEWIKGGQGDSTVSVIAVGGRSSDGSGMTTEESLKLTPGNRYVVFLAEGAHELLVPFVRVLQVHEDGSLVADEAGRILERIDEGRPIFRTTAEVDSLYYLSGPSALQTMVEGAPGAAEVQAETTPSSGGEDMDVSRLLGELRELAGILDGEAEIEPWQERIRKTTLISESAPSSSGLVAQARFVLCGFHRTALNFYSYIPDNDNWTWFSQSLMAWNDLVDISTGKWFIGNYLSSGAFIRNRLPQYRDGKNNCAVVTSAQMISAGYGSWASYGNTPGICFTWFFDNERCDEIEENDVLVNTSVKDNEIQFRKTMTHELGHALSLKHETRYMAIMRGGTKVQPPNYSSPRYNRMDDIKGLRAITGLVNLAWSNTWPLRRWADMATWSQSHGSPGTTGSLVMTDSSRYTVAAGSTITLRHMHVENRGNLPAYSVSLRVYLSTNRNITSSDREITRHFWGEFAPHSAWANQSLTVHLPLDIRAGQYYIGWIVTTPTSELERGNNTAIMRKSASYNFEERKLTILPPANDDCADARRLAIPGRVMGATSTATTDSAPYCRVSNTAPGLWYKVTGTGTRITASTCGGEFPSTFDTKVSVYCGGCSGISCVSGNDDGCGAGDNDSSVSFCSIAGEEYLILVHGVGSEAGIFNLYVSQDGRSCHDATSCSRIALRSNEVECGQSLPRRVGNCISLPFEGNITRPSAGQLKIQRLLPGESFASTNLSSQFTYTVEGGNVLKIVENGDVLSNLTWYAIRNTGDWTGVAPFKVDIRVLYGDVDNSGVVNSFDVNDVWRNRTADAVDGCNAYDINGDGYINAFDANDTWRARYNSTAPAKPSGHRCNP